MSTEISPQNERYIQDLIERGSFRDRGAVLDAGIELLRLRAELADRIEEGHRQLKEGQTILTCSSVAKEAESRQSGGRFRQPNSLLGTVAPKCSDSIFWVRR